MIENEYIPLAKQYDSLAVHREPFLRRAEDSARLTIPSQFPPKGSTATTVLNKPYQALGSRGVSHLANKIVLALFPPNAPVFRMTISDKEVQKITQDPAGKQAIEEAFAAYEREVTQEIELSDLRDTNITAAIQLLIAGNVLVYLPDGEGSKFYKLNQYVVNRSPMGEVYEIIIKEAIDKRTLPDDAKALLVTRSNKESSGNDYECDLYTKIYRHQNMWHVYQEIDEQRVPGSDGTYPLDACPWIALRYSKSPYDYSNGFIEDHVMGDLISYESLSKSLVLGAAAAAKILYLVNPNGTTKAKTLAEKESGEFAAGRIDDVGVLQLNKNADFSVANARAEVIKRDLEFSFMLNTAVQRNGERVTAEEIRQMTSELDAAAGGIYSILSREYIYPLVKRVISRMTTNGTLPSLPKDVAKPAVVTGISALGRGNDLTRLNSFMQGIAPLGPDVVARYLKSDGFISRVASATNIDPKGLVKSPEEVQQELQQQALLAAAQAAGPNLAKNLTPNLELPNNGS